MNEIEERFLTKIAKGDCWEWLAYCDAYGYGRFTPRKGKTVLAHRFSYEMHIGAIPEGLTIDHLCRNRACVNPDHLEPVTIRENVMRGDTIMARHAAKTHCKHGHEFTPENTYIRPGTGHRDCKTCQADRARARKARRNSQVSEASKLFPDLVEALERVGG